MPQSIEITRQQFYDLVWSRSVGAVFGPNTLVSFKVWTYEVG